MVLVITTACGQLRPAGMFRQQYGGYFSQRALALWYELEILDRASKPVVDMTETRSRCL